MKMPPRRWAALLLSLAFGALAAAPAAAGVSHGIAMHGEPAYPSDFEHFGYVEPGAPRGGRLTIGVQGAFDSLNPLIVRGAPARGLRDYVFESLMARSYDEPFSLYGLLAESIETPEDRSWAEFTLRSEARFSDGTPLTPEDVVFSWEVLKEKGMPNHRSYYGQVAGVTVVGERTVRFEFAGEPDREMPLIIGLMPILPAHHYDLETFENTGLETPVGSGPYVVEEVEPGSGITYRRNPDYWGDGLPVTRGRFNFDEIRFDYYRDANTMFEAFRRGLTDVRPEDDPGRWATGYDFPAVASGDIVLDEFETAVPRGMSAFVFNTRRPVFADIRVRQALLHLFDAEWINRNLYHGLYRRTGSYFEGSELAFSGHPAGAVERGILGSRIEDMDPSIVDGTYEPPASDGSGRDRGNLRRALALLGEAGYAVDGQGTLRDADTGEPLSFEILVVTRDQERLALAFQRALRRVGIAVAVRQIDSAQFERRRQTFDFDMIQYYWAASLSPGNEQRFYWGSDAAATDGTRNYMGVADPAVDRAIDAMLAADDRDNFVQSVRALDRALIAGTYVVPLFHLERQWVARARHIGRPETTSLYGYLLDTWWRRPAGDGG